MTKNRFFRHPAFSGILPAFCLILAATIHLEAAENLYRIIDLKTGETTETPATPADLLKNKDYKETKMVFRRIPAGIVIMNEGRTEATLSREYWLAVFECTQVALGSAGLKEFQAPQTQLLCLSWTPEVIGNQSEMPPISQG